jgi:2-polyprenyl-6-methoxyphenol hydroxylase-like FAD-dependent oxidoreductase
MTHDIGNGQQTDCCIVGGGPAGAVLALLLVRKGIAVTLLEARLDFDRDFRGDTIHPSVMEIMDEVGLADRLLQLRHAKIRRFYIQTADALTTIADFSRLKTRYPYITMLPQVDFLEFITAEAQRSPHFRLVMGANVQELIEEDGLTRGVRYRGPDGWHEVHALLTVGADGRFSRIRRLAGLESIKASPPMDVLWFRLPRRPEDPEDAVAALRAGRGLFLVLIDRFEQWQLGYVFPKDGYQQVRAAGLQELRRSVVQLVPWLSDRIEHLQEWKQVSVLSVETSSSTRPRRRSWNETPIFRSSSSATSTPRMASSRYWALMPGATRTPLP